MEIKSKLKILKIGGLKSEVGCQIRPQTSSC